VYQSEASRFNHLTRQITQITFIKQSLNCKYMKFETCVAPTPFENGQRTPFYHVKHQAQIDILLSSVSRWLFLGPCYVVASL